MWAHPWDDDCPWSAALNAHQAACEAVRCQTACGSCRAWLCFDLDASARSGRRRNSSARPCSIPSSSTSSLHGPLWLQVSRHGPSKHSRRTRGSIPSICRLRPGRWALPTTCSGATRTRCRICRRLYRGHRIFGPMPSLVGRHPCAIGSARRGQGRGGGRAAHPTLVHNQRDAFY